MAGSETSTIKSPIPTPGSPPTSPRLYKKRSAEEPTSLPPAKQVKRTYKDHVSPQEEDVRAQDLLQRTVQQIDYIAKELGSKGLIDAFNLLKGLTNPLIHDFNILIEYALMLYKNKDTHDGAMEIAHQHLSKAINSAMRNDIVEDPHQAIQILKQAKEAAIECEMINLIELAEKYIQTKEESLNKFSTT